MKKILPVFLLLLSVFVLYAQTLGFGLLRYDDPDYTIACAFVKDGLGWANVLEAFVNFRHGGIWMPLTYFTYMFDVSFLGGTSSAFHLINIILHASNAVLLWWLLSAAFERGRLNNGDISFLRWLAFAATAFWALHPQRVEAVAWVAARKELLWTFFALFGLMAWVRGRWLAATFCMACSCLSKPTGMVFPLLAFALDVMISPRSDPSRDKVGRFRAICRYLPFRCAICRYLPFLVLSLATGLIAVYSQTHPEGMAVKDLFHASFAHRLVNAVNAIGLYIAQALIPCGIHLDYRSVPTLLPLGWQIGLPVALLSLGSIGSLGSLGGLGTLRTLKTLRTLIPLWLLGGLLPTLGIFGSFGEQARADRFFYLPAMAFAWAILVAVPRSRQRIAALVVLLITTAFAVITFYRVGDYRNDRTVFERTLACDSENGRALAHVGEAQCAAGDLDGGIEALRKSAQLRPRRDTTAKLAYALMRRGRREDYAEIRAITDDVAAQPASDIKGQALEALGTAELVAGEWDKAASHLIASIGAPSRFYSALDAQLKLAFALHNVGRRGEAGKLFDMVYKSGRTDLVARAEAAILARAEDPAIILFW